MVKEDSIMVHTMFISAPLSLAPMTCTVDSFKCIRADQTILAPLTDFEDNKVIPFDFFRFGWSRFRASRKLQCRVCHTVARKEAPITVGCDNHRPNVRQGGWEGGDEGAWKESIPGVESPKDLESRHSKASGDGGQETVANQIDSNSQWSQKRPYFSSLSPRRSSLGD